VKKLKVTLVYNSKMGLRKEFDGLFCGKEETDEEPPPDFFAEGDNPETINAIVDALRVGGYSTQAVEADENIISSLRKINPDFIFNIAEGLVGDLRESYVPMICERIGIPFTGSSPLTLAICLNKARTKEILSFYGIPTPVFKLIRGEKDYDSIKYLRFPIIIKPVSEGSSKGIYEDSFVETKKEAKNIIEKKIKKYKQPVIVEEFLTGDEYTTALWGNGESVEVLPIIAINFDGLPSVSKKIYSYEAKWIWDRPENPIEIFKCPAEIPKQLKKTIELTAKNAYTALDVKDWCRIDIRLDKNGIPNVLELNPLPGILPDPNDNSCFPKAARAAGYDYKQMINEIIKISRERYGI
jgi:D-alanine-D-alanine ligase